MIETPVLIVGAGPVGLSLSLMLAQQGVASMVVNDRMTTTTHPKLDVVNTRSMEIFRQLGLSERIRDAGNPRDANQYAAIGASASGPFYAVMSDRHLIYRPAAEAKAIIAGCRDGSQPLETMQRIAQMNLEPVLVDAVREQAAIDLRFGWRLFGFEQDAGGVTALLHHVETGRSQHVRSQYLIGCDGPNSRVRNFLNIDYDGTRDLVGELFIIHFRSDEVAALYPNDQTYWHSWISRPGYSALLVSPDASRNDFVLHRPFAPRPGEPLEDVIDAALGAKLHYDIVQSGPWRPQFLVAESFGRDRVFIAGDATHQYMPTGGLGMNTGLAEAHNLAWKLAAMVKGWGGPRLLASYEAERRPVALRNRDHVKSCAAAAFEPNFEVGPHLLDDSAAGKANRDQVAEAFIAKTSRLYESMGIEIGYRYGSGILQGGGANAAQSSDVTQYVPDASPGARLPVAFLSDGAAVQDRLDPKGMTLIHFPDADASEIEALVGEAAKVGMPLTPLALDGSALAPVFAASLLLIRPDGHVAWRGAGIAGKAAELVDLVRGA